MSKKNKCGRYCSVYGCTNNSNTNPELTYFSLPTEPERRNLWLTMMGREDYLNKFSLRVLVCEEHIKPIDIMLTTGRKILKKTAFPSLRLPAGRRVERAVQASLSDEERELAAPRPSPSASRLRARLMVTSHNFSTKSIKDQELELQHIQRSNFYELCNQYLSDNLAQFVKSYNFLRLKQRDDDYSVAYKQFCWSLYFASRQTYRFFEKILGLPHINTLKKIWTKISTEMTDEFLLVLKAKVDNMTERERNCSLTVSVFEVKPGLCYHFGRDVVVGLQEVDGVQSPAPARRALLAAVRGLLAPWTQPVVFVFLAECKSYNNISVWIQKVVRKLLQIGLNIRAIVSNLDSDLMRATRNECVTVEEPFFLVGEHKIYQIVDTSYLMKQVCCCFRTFDFQYGDNSVAKFGHVQKFYELDKSRSVRHSSDLTDVHMESMSVDETEVHHAAALLNKSLATGISLLADFGVIDQSANDTAKFLLLMNEFFECLKSFRGEDAQLELFDKVQNFFPSLKILDPHNGADVTKIVNFMEGLYITVESITRLHKDLKREGYNNVVFTRYLNQDIADSFFKKTRAKCRAASLPTCRQLASALRRFYATEIMKPIKYHSNDFDTVKFIEEIYNISLKSGIGTNRSIFSAPNKTNVFFEVSSSDYNSFDLPATNSLLYICGCLLKKCYDRHDCDLMRKYMDVSEAALRSSNYTRYSEFTKKNNSQLPAIPPNDFVDYIVKLERVFSNSFGSTHLAAAFGASLYEHIKQIKFSPPCPCFPTPYLQKLFVRMRIYSTIKFNNKTLRQEENIKREQTLRQEENIKREH